MSTSISPGDRVYDKWTRQVVTVVAGAQPGGYVTAEFADHMIVVIDRKHVAQL